MRGVRMKPRNCLRLVPFAGLCGLMLGLLGGCTPEGTEGPHLDPARALPAGVAEAGWPRTFTDDLGVEITLDKPPERVVSIPPGVTEVIFALGEGDRLVGISDFCDYPPEVAEKESVGNISEPSVEKIISLQPDLVFAVRGVKAEVIESLRGAGINVMGENPESLGEVIELVREVGRCLGADAQAAELATEMTARRDRVQERTQERLTSAKRVRVLFTIGIEPLFVAGPASFVHDLIDLAGGANVVGEGGEEINRPWPQYSVEKVIEHDPDAIIAATGEHTEEGGDLLERLRDKTGWRDLSAVRDGRVYEVDPDLLLRVGPRLLDGLEALEKIMRDQGEEGE